MTRHAARSAVQGARVAARAIELRRGRRSRARVPGRRGQVVPDSHRRPDRRRPRRRATSSSGRGKCPSATWPSRPRRTKATRARRSRWASARRSRFTTGPASARLAVAEAVLNIAAADVAALGDIRLSANWMAAAGHGDDDYALYAMVRAVGEELCPALGLAVPVGKDSLSMRTVWHDDGQRACRHGAGVADRLGVCARGATFAAR